MLDFLKNAPLPKKINLRVLAVALLVLLALLLLWFNLSNSTQSFPAMVAQVRFEGEYRIGDGGWKSIVPGEHIPSTEGDVILRGNFHMLMPDGEYVGIYRDEIPVAFYLNHISLTINEGNGESVVSDIENRIYGSSTCCVSWMAYVFTSAPEQTVELVVHNPHRYGNETAIDEMLSGVALWSGIDFEKSILDSGDTERNIGLFFTIISLMLLGIALFSSLIHIKNSKLIWMLGSLVLFAGIYFIYSADGVSFFSESLVSNTTVLGASMMLYMLFATMIIVSNLRKMRKIGEVTVFVSGAVDAVLFLLPVLSKLLFYDMWLVWIFAQLAVNVTLIYCLVREIFSSEHKMRWLYLGAFLPLIAFAVDIVGVYLGAWRGGVGSQYAFVALFFVALVMVLKLIPENINAATKARELEMEKITLNAALAESRVSTMMSQIRPHFIYNTLGSIEQLCKLDPQKAGELVHNFAKYLRGNFGELDNPRPILMSQEMDHVHHYISIENVRFPDMTFTFEMNSPDFPIPDLTVQPIVENAIKHGLMKLPRGGTIRVVSYETESAFCISVIDDGVGFDTSVTLEDRKHLGLRNIRERLKVMVGGSLEIESTPGVGTKVLITIPKEVQTK